MKKLLYLVVFFFSFALQAQKVMEKEIELHTISNVIIDGNGIFKITILANKTKTILIKAIIEGEHNEDIVLVTQTTGSDLSIFSKFQPLFIPDNDKLSAHKVISIELTISIPEHLNVFIQSDISSVIAEGQFNNLTIELINGSCTVNSFTGNAIINTINGSIYINSNEATVNAVTKNGILIKEELSNGKNRLNLNSINGNIKVNKNE